MPRVRRKAKARREYTDGDIKQILTGVSLSHRFGNVRRCHEDIPAMRAAWGELQDELLPAWVSEHPFTRPFVFWFCIATEPRERVTGEAREEAGQWVGDRPRSDYRRCWFENLNVRLGYPDTRPETGEYETEKQYLFRLDLLLDSERALL